MAKILEYGFVKHRGLHVVNHSTTAGAKRSPEVSGLQQKQPYRSGTRGTSSRRIGLANRNQRRCGMADTQAIKEHMEVVGSDGAHVGTVDHLEGDKRIKLTKTDPAAGGQHHFISADWIESVDKKVHLKKSAKDAKAQWQSAA
jgi:hypothetical protein